MVGQHHQRGIALTPDALASAEQALPVDGFEQELVAHIIVRIDVDARLVDCGPFGSVAGSDAAYPASTHTSASVRFGDILTKP